ncbi:MAG: hypothetical protein AAGC67_13560 [Myxococcota bacterium]
MTEAIRAAGGEIYAVTSEPHSLARDAEADWGTGLVHVGDPHQEIERTCRDRDWLALFKYDWDGERLGKHADWLAHPKGYYQPGVLVLDRSGRVLYRWRCRPTRWNAGGATGRPTPEHVWQAVQRARTQPPGTADAAHDDAPDLDAPPTPMPLFVLILLANGGFLRPQTFDHYGGAFTSDERIRRAQIRLAFFVAAWLVAAWLLPGWLVGLAFAAWLVAIVPGVRAILDGFQSVADDEEPA